MKYFKLFLLVAAIAFFGSCSDDKETQNTNSDVVVEMESPTFSAKESAGSVKVPIKVTGKTNGKVYVTMTMKECNGPGDNPAKKDVHYYVADTTITISDEIGYVEYRAVDDKEMNEDRKFQFVIKEAKGAKIGAQNTTTVTIVDNDNAPYDRLQGEWTLSAKDPDGQGDSFTVTITEPNELNEDGTKNHEYGMVLYMDGFMGLNAGNGINMIKLNFSYNEKTMQGYVAFDCTESYTLFTNEFTGLGEADVKVRNADNSNSPLFGNWDSDFTTVTFTPGSGIMLTVFPKSTGAYAGYAGLYTDIVLTKSK
ncbi:hypothetical protein [uncultured Prevotella sp.]|uniref:Calx-beta domain-containing protein n=1 Tax=uncultured Prevotella sp. TaxID=159272 RepID=UPI0026DB3A38|nr:hypothetical protein [uncultured Prevotella sp.]